MKSNAPFRATKFGPIDTQKTRRADGSILLQLTDTLRPYPARLTERLIHWAEMAPDRVFMAHRDSAADGVGEWQTLTYKEMLVHVRVLAQALLDRQLSSERTMVILSENSLEHAMLALAAVHVGIPYAPISPPYSLLSADFGKLRHTLNLMTPKLIFASDGQAYAKALRVANELFPDATLVVAKNPPAGLACESLSDLQATVPTAAVEAAFDEVTPDTVAKVLFTSGSTSMPKGVINTHRLWCANLQQITQTLPFMLDEPPLFVDWLPWNHTFGGNHNVGLTLYNGGSLYIDEGKPTPTRLSTTIANLRELAPTAYFNVPKGFEQLIPYLRREAQLREKFFSRLQMIFYAGASLPQHIWDSLEELSAETTGYRVPIITGLGMTESGPAAMFSHWPGSYSGLLGVPVPGLQLKLVVNEDKLEARYRGPNVTPGYWRQPEITAACFDDEGFFCTGDAVKFADESDPNQGMLFDGRIAEDFKLMTGTWVSVGNLRMALLKQGAPIVQDSVITGHDRDYVGAILYLNVDACRQVAGLTSSVAATEVYQHPVVREQVQLILDKLASSATGSSTRIRRVLIANQPPSIDMGEITDKGSLNQRRILRHRGEWVEALYTEPMPDHVFKA